MVSSPTYYQLPPQYQPIIFCRRDGETGVGLPPGWVWVMEDYLPLTPDLITELGLIRLETLPERHLLIQTTQLEYLDSPRKLDFLRAKGEVILELSLMGTPGESYDFTIGTQRIDTWTLTEEPLILRGGLHPGLAIYQSMDIFAHSLKPPPLRINLVQARVSNHQHWLIETQQMFSAWGEGYKLICSRFGNRGYRYMSGIGTSILDQMWEPKNFDQSPRLTYATPTAYPPLRESIPGEDPEEPREWVVEL